MGSELGSSASRTSVLPTTLRPLLWTMYDFFIAYGSPPFSEAVKENRVTQCCKILDKERGNVQCRRLHLDLVCIHFSTAHALNTIFNETADKTALALILRVFCWTPGVPYSVTT